MGKQCVSKLIKTKMNMGWTYSMHGWKNVQIFSYNTFGKAKKKSTLEMHLNISLTLFVI